VTGEVRSAGIEGRNVLVTRAKDQAEELCRLLQIEGAVPIPVAVMGLKPLLEQLELFELRRRISVGDFDDIVFTSANAARLLLAGPATKGSGQPRVFAIGPDTKAAITQAGWPVEELPEDFIAESLAARILEGGVEGRRFLLPRAEGARGTLPEMLGRGGAEVLSVATYRMEPELESGPQLRELLERKDLDSVTFTSGSSVECFLDLAQGLRPPPGCVLACIGPITALTLRRAHLQPEVVATTYSLKGLVSALTAAFQRLPENGGRP
jgi:uroporphyrinogen III methyltransferase/synthase